MDIEAINCFLTLSQLQNFSAAAEECHMTQSSLSKKIKHLEQYLGVTLFERTTRNVNLTEAGLIFKQRSVEMLQTYELLQAQLQPYSKHFKCLKIGSIPVLNQYNLTVPLAEFKQTLQPQTFELIEAEHDELVKALALNQIDVAIMRSDQLDKAHFEIYPLVEDELVFLCANTHSLAQRKVIQLSELKDEPFIFLNPTSGVYQTCKQRCEEEGFSPNIIQTQQKIETIIGLVSAGFGCSMLMKKSLACFNQTNMAVTLISPVIKSELAIVISKDKVKNQSLQSFISFMVTKSMRS